MFVLEDSGVVVHDCNPAEEDTLKLLAMSVPNYILLRNSKSVGQSLVQKKMLRDFAGLQMTDKKTKDAIVNFSMYLCIGNMDEAFKAIKAVPCLGPGLTPARSVQSYRSLEHCLIYRLKIPTESKSYQKRLSSINQCNCSKVTCIRKVKKQTLKKKF